VTIAKAQLDARGRFKMAMTKHYFKEEWRVQPQSLMSSSPNILLQDSVNYEDHTVDLD
jgi:hypothetical protein